MKLAYLALAVSLAAATLPGCAAEEADAVPQSTFVPGTWERYDGTGRVAERLTIAEDGTFSDRYLLASGLAEEATGTWFATEREIVFEDVISTPGLWVDTVQRFTYFADAAVLVRGAFVRDATLTSGNGADYFAADTSSTTGAYLTLTGNSFFAEWAPPWGPERELFSGGAYLYDDGANIDTYWFDYFADGAALGQRRNDGSVAGIASYPLDLALTYDRAE